MKPHGRLPEHNWRSEIEVNHFQNENLKLLHKYMKFTWQTYNALFISPWNDEQAMVDSRNVFATTNNNKQYCIRSVKILCN